LTLFESELNDLNSITAPIIIALGGAVYNILLQEFGNKYHVYKVSHYAMYINADKYRGEFLELESRLTKER
jgi:hypothetical protein